MTLDSSFSVCLYGRVSTFGLSNNERQWLVWVVPVAANRRILSQNWLTWSEGWRPSDAQSVFITQPDELLLWLNVLTAAP